jgi:hypothetical protein
MKGRILIFLPVLLPLFIFVYSCSNTGEFEKINDNGDRYVSVAEGVKFYQDKNPTSEIIGTIPPAEKVTCRYLLTSGDSVKWYFVEWKNAEGWVSAEDRSKYPFNEVLIKNKIDISHAYFNEIKHRYEYEKNAPDISHDTSQGYYDSAVESINNNDLINAEKSLFYALYYDVTWARAYYLYAKTLIMKAAPEENDIIRFYVTCALDLGYNYLYKDMAADSGLKDFSDLIETYGAMHENRAIAEDTYGRIRKNGLTVSLEHKEEYDPDENPFDPDNYELFVDHISLGPFANDKGRFISIDNEKSLSARFGFEMTESIDFTPADYYTIENNGNSVDIYLDCGVVRGSESLKDGDVIESAGSDTIHIHLEKSNNFCESGVIGKHDITLDFNN